MNNSIIMTLAASTIQSVGDSDNELLPVLAGVVCVLLLALAFYHFLKWMD